MCRCPEGEGKAGDQSVPKWERKLTACFRRERTLQRFQEEKVLLAETEYGSMAEQPLDGRRGPECFLGNRKASLPFWVEMHSSEPEACKSYVKIEIETGSPLNILGPQTGVGWGWG